MILPGQSVPVAKVITRYRDGILLRENEVEMNGGYHGDAAVPEHMEPSAGHTTSCLSPAAEAAALPVSIEVPLSPFIEPLSDEELAVLFASCMSPSSPTSDIDVSKDERLLGGGGAGGGSPMSMSPCASQQDLAWLTQLQEAEWLVDAEGMPQSTNLNVFEKSLSATSTPIIATVVAAENVGLFDADSLPVAVADAAIAVGHPAYDKDSDYFGDWYDYCSQGEEEGGEAALLADQPGVVLAEPLQLRPIPLHLSSCEPYTPSGPAPTTSGAGGGWSPENLCNEEAIDAWLSQFMLEQDFAMSSYQQNQQQQHRGFEETKDDDDDRNCYDDTNTVAAAGSLGYHNGYEIAEAKCVAYDRPLHRVASGVLAYHRDAKESLPSSGGTVPHTASTPAAAVPPVYQPSVSLPMDYRGLRAHHWRERRSRANRSRSSSIASGSSAVATKIKLENMKSPHQLPRNIAPSGMLSSINSNLPSLNSGAQHTVLNSKQAASLKRSRTNGKFTKCKISWVSISDLENQPGGGAK